LQKVFVIDLQISLNISSINIVIMIFFIIFIMEKLLFTHCHSRFITICYKDILQAFITVISLVGFYTYLKSILSSVILL